MYNAQGVWLGKCTGSDSVIWPVIALLGAVIAFSLPDDAVHVGTIFVCAQLKRGCKNHCDFYSPLRTGVRGIVHFI